MRSRQSRRQPWLMLLLALAAVGFLLAMLLTTEHPETRQLVKFEARGVLTELPETVYQVELQCGEHTTTFVRLANAEWAYGGRREAVSDELRDHLNQAILFMHTAGPVRVLQRNEYDSAALQEFGLEQPRCAVTLSDTGRVLLTARFGADNPQDLLQYMQLTGSDTVYLMSRFVGQTWQHIGEHIR